VPFHEDHGNTHAFHEQQHSSNNSARRSKITAPIIEKLVKQFKTQHAVTDFDNIFVSMMVKMEEIN
jgi:hypothetical protein